MNTLYIGSYKYVDMYKDGCEIERKMRDRQARTLSLINLIIAKQNISNCSINKLHENKFKNHLR